MKYKVVWIRKHTGQKDDTGTKTFSSQEEAAKFINDKKANDDAVYSKFQPESTFAANFGADGIYVYSVNEIDEKPKLKVGDTVIIDKPDLTNTPQKCLVCQLGDKYCLVAIDEHHIESMGESLIFSDRSNDAWDPSNCLFDSLDELEKYCKSEGFELEAI